jgi:hypothetical protein
VDMTDFDIAKREFHAAEAMRNSGDIVP